MEVETGSTYENPRSGAKATVLESWTDTDGRRFVWERTLPPGTGKGALPHVHADFSQRFECIAGSVKVKLDGDERTLAAGEAVEVPTGVPHLDGWNEGPDEATWRMTIEPVPRFVEVYGKTYLDAFMHGRLNRQDEFPLMWIFEISRVSDGQSWGPGPVGLQRALRPMLAALARARGYRAIE